MKTRKNAKFFLVLSCEKVSSAAQAVLARISAENPDMAVKIAGLRSGKATAVTAALGEGIRHGAKEIYILPMGKLPSRALRNDIPLAVRQVREKNMTVDFHYGGVHPGAIRL